MANIVITKERRITATVDETIEYEVDAAAWAQALDDASGDEEEALESLRSNSEAKTNSYACEIDEVLEEHEVSVEA